MFLIIYKDVKEGDSRTADEFLGYKIIPKVGAHELLDKLKSFKTFNLLAILPNDVDPQILAQFLKM